MRQHAIDIMGLVGVAALVNGVRLWSPAAAWVVGGAVLVAAAWVLSRGEA
jgi:hypothetical protein